MISYSGGDAERKSINRLEDINGEKKDVNRLLSSWLVQGRTRRKKEQKQPEKKAITQTAHHQPNHNIQQKQQQLTA